MASRCRTCGARLHAPARTCPHCGGRVPTLQDWGWRAAWLVVCVALAAAIGTLWREL